MNGATTSSNELRDLYRELILDHARKPRHFGELPGATHSASGINPLCGDKLNLYLALNDKQRIETAQFHGSGCAISVASASLLTEHVIGMHRNEALALFVAVTGQLTGKTADSEGDIGKLNALQGVREFPTRVKCATLAWHALRSALAEDRQPATTE